jgi:hypothetical protein
MGRVSALFWGRSAGPSHCCVRGARDRRSGGNPLDESLAATISAPLTRSATSVVLAGIGYSR